MKKELKEALRESIQNIVNSRIQQVFTTDRQRPVLTLRSNILWGLLQFNMGNHIPSGSISDSKNISESTH